jgi:hypothetical protein
MISYPKLVEGILQADASQHKVRLLFGARQAGKSTLLQRLSDPNTRVFNLQERRTRMYSPRSYKPATAALRLYAWMRSRRCLPPWTKSSICMTNIPAVSASC